MKPNPGGQLDASEIIGRDQLITKMWEVLSGRNIYMNDLRRIGKTMILSKMQSAPPKGWRVSKRDFEGLRSADEFATQVFRDALNLQSREKRIFKRMTALLGNVDEFEVPGILKIKLSDRTVASPWKEVLTRTLADLHDAYGSGNERVVFLWDEIPLMIENILVEEGASQAMEVLDTLRSLSQDYPSIRFVLTGSVGIHHILKRLRQDGYNNSPLITFERIAPGPLAESDAVCLAEALIIGAGLCDTVLMLVIMAVTKSSSRSSKSGIETTVRLKTTTARIAPITWPMARNINPDGVVNRTRSNPSTPWNGS